MTYRVVKLAKYILNARKMSGKAYLCLSNCDKK